jgi:hypothetical protein
MSLYSITKSTEYDFTNITPIIISLKVVIHNNDIRQYLSTSLPLGRALVEF